MLVTLIFSIITNKAQKMEIRNLGVEMIPRIFKHDPQKFKAILTATQQEADQNQFIRINDPEKVLIQNILTANATKE